MLATGRVDAIIRFLNAAFSVEQALNETKKELVVIPWAQYGLRGYSNSIYASESMLESRRDVVVRFLRAMKKATLATRDDPAAAAAALKKAVPESDPAITEQVSRAALRLMFSDNTTRDGLGVFSPELVKTTWDWVAKAQGVPIDQLDPQQSVDFSFGKN
jgi:NitT/TauT family transport system substrate-binding protein